MARDCASCASSGVSCAPGRGCRVGEAPSRRVARTYSAGGRAVVLGRRVAYRAGGNVPAIGEPGWDEYKATLGEKGLDPNATDDTTRAVLDLIGQATQAGVAFADRQANRDYDLARAQAGAQAAGMSTGTVPVLGPDARPPPTTAPTYSAGTVAAVGLGGAAAAGGLWYALRGRR